MVSNHEPLHSRLCGRIESCKRALHLYLALSLSLSLSRSFSFSELLEGTHDSQPTISLSIDYFAIDVRGDVNHETLDGRDRKLSRTRIFSKPLEGRQNSRTEPRTLSKGDKTVRSTVDVDDLAVSVREDVRREVVDPRDRAPCVQTSGCLSS